MERTQELFEKIEGYLNNTLSQDELTAFEKQMTESEALQQEVEKHRALHDALSDTDVLAFREKVIKIGKEIKAEEQQSGSGFSKFWKIAAVVLVLVSVGSLLWFTMGSKDSPKELYAEYYKPFPVEDVTRGESVNEKLKDILSKYTNGQYDKVVIALEKWKDSIGKEQVKLYLANSYLNTNKEEKAIPIFQNVSINSQYYENARWYLALTHLKLDQIPQLKQVLQQLIAYNGIYKEKAEALLKEL